MYFEASTNTLLNTNVHYVLNVLIKNAAMHFEVSIHTWLDTNVCYVNASIENTAMYFEGSMNTVRYQRI